MKSFRYILLVSLLTTALLLFGSCGSTEENTASAGADDTAVTEEDAAAEEAADVSEDFDLAGDWQDETSQRAMMAITAGEGDNSYDVEITWANSATEAVVWTFSGTYDPAEGFLYYQDCRKATVTEEEDAGTGGEDIEYEGGTGRLTYKDGALLWQDDKDNAGENCRFVKVNGK